LLCLCVLVNGHSPGGLTAANANRPETNTNRSAPVPPAAPAAAAPNTLNLDFASLLAQLPPTAGTAPAAPTTAPSSGGVSNMAVASSAPTQRPRPTSIADVLSSEAVRTSGVLDDPQGIVSIC
jgi:hypothetical protein